MFTQIMSRIKQIVFTQYVLHVASYYKVWEMGYEYQSMKHGIKYNMPIVYIYIYIYKYGVSTVVLTEQLQWG